MSCQLSQPCNCGAAGVPGVHAGSTNGSCPSDQRELPTIPIGYQQVLDSLPDGITIQDREFNIIYQNQAMRQSFGPHVGAKCYRIYEQRDEVCEGCGVRRVFQSGKLTTVIRTAFDTEGATSYWENVCCPIRDAGGNVVAAAEVCRNISNRVTLEAEVKDRNIELGQLTKELKR